MTRARRRSTFAIFFSFMLLHQVDRYLIGPLTTPIMETFRIDEARMGTVLTGAVLVGAVFFPLWGYLFDRYARPRILALASLLWGATTWLGAIAPTYGTFVAARATTGIDDATYPGIYSMVSDVWGPARRGRIIGMLQLSGPLAYIIGTVAGLSLAASLGWRAVFYITGGLGVVMAMVLWTRLRDVPRGAAEPALDGVDVEGRYTFEWSMFRRLMRRRTMRLLILQVFVHLFPIQALLLWSIRYFETERGFDNQQIYLLSGALVVVGMVGFVQAGWLGDRLFQHTRRGRLLVGATGVACAAVSMVAAFAVPTESTVAFMAFWAAASFFYGFSNPTVTPTVQDITEPEVRSTAHAAMGIAEQTGSALAPLTVGLIAVQTSLGVGLMSVTGLGFGLSAVLLFVAAVIVPGDVDEVRTVLEARAERDG